MSGDALNLQVGERLTLSGLSVVFPYDTFLYEIVSINEDNTEIKLKIVEKNNERTHVCL